MHESTTVPCPRCGAALPIDPAAVTATCLYCRAVAPVPPAIHEAAAAHAARVRAADFRAADAERALATYRGSAVWSSAWWKIAGGMFAVMVGCNILRPILSRFFREDVIGAFVPLAVYGALGYFGYHAYKTYRSSKSPHLAPAQVSSVCGRCGGPLTFEAGSTTAVCHACRGVAIAGKTVQFNLAAMAEQRARDLDVERGRAERQMYRNAAPVQQFSRIYVTLSLLAPLLMLTLGLLIGGTVEAIEGIAGRNPHEAQEGLTMLVVGALLAAAACGAFALYHAVTTGPQRHAEEQLRRLAVRLGGRVVRGGTKPALDWLDAHWLGPAPFELMMQQQERTRLTLETAFGGMPAIVVAIFASGAMRFTGKKLHVLVAAPRARRPLGPSPVAADLGRLGFEPKLGDDGVALARFESNPEVMSETTIGWALTEAATLARS